jgi:hypothetical protein
VFATPRSGEIFLTNPPPPRLSVSSAAPAHVLCNHAQRCSTYSLPSHQKNPSLQTSYCVLSKKIKANVLLIRIIVDREPVNRKNTIIPELTKILSSSLFRPEQIKSLNTNHFVVVVKLHNKNLIT